MYGSRMISTIFQPSSTKAASSLRSVEGPRLCTQLRIFSLKRRRPSWKATPEPTSEPIHTENAAQPSGKM